MTGDLNRDGTGCDAAVTMRSARPNQRPSRTASSRPPLGPAVMRQPPVTAGGWRWQGAPRPAGALTLLHRDLVVKAFL